MQDKDPLLFLCGVVQETDLLTRNTPSLRGILDATGRHRKRELPVLPVLFVLADHEASDDVAPDEYCKRFTAHLGQELRCSILADYEEFLARCVCGHWKRAQAIQRAIKQRGKSHARGPPTHADVWRQQAPLHPHVKRLAIAVTWEHKTALGFTIRAMTGDALTKLRKQMYADEWRTTLRNPVVEQAVRDGVAEVLRQDAIVVMLVPLAACADAWLGARTGGAMEQSATALVGEARSVLNSLPNEWVEMGCIPRLARVSDAHYDRGLVSLEIFPLYAAHDAQGSVIQRLFKGCPWTKQPFFVAELSSLKGALMELEALYSIDSTRFAATLYDPRHTAPQSTAFYDWATSLLSAAGPLRATPLLPVLRARLLLQQQLNDWQIRAVTAVLYAVCPRWDGGVAEQVTQAVMPRAPEVLMIEGPPGTGKTQTIGSLTLNLVHHLSRVRGTAPRVLVCAPSNCAVDEALLRVVRLRKQLSEAAAAGGEDAGVAQRPAQAVLSGGLLRIGVRDKVDAEVLKLDPPVFLDDVVAKRLKGEGTPREMQKMYYRRKKELGEEEVRSAVVIFSTLGTLPRLQKLMGAIAFDVVVVDEASQCTEPAVLQALHVTAGKCVLVGDTNQLQPTVISNDAGESGLRRSLLVRLLSCGHRSFMLRTQYRMHPDIVAFPNAYFYNSKLLTDESVHARHLVPTGSTEQLTIAQRLGLSPRFVFVDVANAQMERRGGRSLQNPLEAAAVVDVMRQLRTFFAMSLPEMAERVGVITPYTAQKELLEWMLSSEEKQAGMIISTVDSYQGRENRIILLSLVRTVSAAQLRQAEQPRRGEGAGSGDDSNDLTTAEELDATVPVSTSYGLGFLADWRRLNVALTRAQDLCICFGSTPLIDMAGVKAQAVLGGGRRHHPALTTLSDTPHEVRRVLRADAQDPLTLPSMLKHARAAADREIPASSSAVATPAAAAAVVLYRPGMSFMESLE